MAKQIGRLTIAVILGVILSNILPASINNGLIQALFTVLGIVFSIAMGLLVSFNLSSVLNNTFRDRIRNSIASTRKWLLIDFTLSTIAFTVGQLYPTYTLNVSHIILRCDVLAISVIITSLIYEIYNFGLINKLRVDIEERLIQEKLKKKADS